MGRGLARYIPVRQVWLSGVSGATFGKYIKG